MIATRLTPLAAALALTLTGVTVQAGIIDDYSGDLSAYTSTVILDANGGGSNTAAWQITGETLELNTSSFDGIEQYAMIRWPLASSWPRSPS